MNSRALARTAALLALGLGADAALAFTAYAIDSTGATLVRFDTATPASVRTSPVTGLNAGESLLSIDFRPTSRALFAVTSGSRLVTIDTETGVAVAIGVAFLPALSGALVEMDFNPTVDRIRVVTEADQNLRLNPTTGATTATDASLAYAAGDPRAGTNPNVVGVGYVNNFAPTTSTTLFDIDSGTDTLATQNPPNNGTLNTIGALGVDVAATAPAGFDIVRSRDGFDVALASLSVDGASSVLYRIDLATGAATAIGSIGPGGLVRGLALRDEDAPEAFALTATNQLVRFSLAQPASILGTPVIVTGLQPGENLVCIDWRPLPAGLVAIGSTSRVYQLNATTGAATNAGGAPFSPALSGSEFGCDVNPTVDRVRVVSDLEQNLRLNPATGALAAADPALNGIVDPDVVAAAYTNSFGGATATTLFDIDSATNQLVIQNPPNNGTLVPVGPLGLDVGPGTHFDIVTSAGIPATNQGFVVANPGATATYPLYAIDLATGTMRLLGQVDQTGVTTNLRGFAVIPPPIFSSGFE